MFQLKDKLGDAPLLEWQYSYNPPKFSAWRRKEVTEEVLGMADVLSDPIDNFGHWSFNGGFKCYRKWRTIEEDEGLGSCDENDTFQEQMADRIVENRGGYVSGRGGTGKSWMLKLLETKFKKLGYDVHYIAFTHVAAANLEGNTILYELHQYAKNVHGPTLYVGSLGQPCLHRQHHYSGWRHGWSIPTDSGSTSDAFAD